ncbi:MAG: ORF6N domain-containing protein, partial [Leptospirales bacterium]|nr:ORF6N domain-containing protein [Leptospirales bacterium]
MLYGVETKRINEAVGNNPDKFPDGYILSLDTEEWQNLKSKISTSSWGGKPTLFATSCLAP